MARDPHIEQAERAREETAQSDVDTERAANLLDIRRIIGLLLGIYGLILLVLGLGASDADIDKAAGVNLNLWTGVALLVVAALFFAWALIRPLSRELGDGA
jgi:drug/metabolite transporter (DMT)-like permease